MVPTELLARQHAETIFNMLEPLGYSSQVSLLVGSLSPSQKKTAHTKIENGEIKLIIGTHALIADKVRFKNLSFVIVDEQHRFGVEQRKKLLSKAGTVPHVLTMTATPIPRSLALTLYGEMEISIINEKPVHQKDVETKIYSPVDRNRVYEKIKKELDLGRQAFVVTPLIQESKVLSQVSAEKKYEEICDVFSKYRVGLLHGKQKTEIKNAVMEKFVAGKTDILVSTTVVEVGVDVPNATVMVIESPERFGLAQVHQLRGRVGRGTSQGYCMLMLSDNKPPSQRLHALETSNDGFKLAELDLEIRGPGAIYGVMQHGRLDLAIAKLTDVHLISKAKKTAQLFIEKEEKLEDYPLLKENVEKLKIVNSLN